MSGGSYDYLAHRGTHLGRYTGALERMAQRLEGLSWAGPAAAETRRVIRMLDEAERLADTLEAPWHAIEWWDSNDWGEDDARKDVEPWRPVEQVRHDGPDPQQLYRLVHTGDGVYELRPITDTDGSRRT